MFKIKILGTRSNNDLKIKLHNGSLPLQVLTRSKDIKLLYPYPSRNLKHLKFEKYGVR